MVTTESARAQDPLTISDLARRTGLTPATLRAWESRHGFPVPNRRASGHRRYDEHDVALVKEVLRRRDAGVRLEIAIADALRLTGRGDDATTSVFAELRRRHPHAAAAAPAEVDPARPVLGDRGRVLRPRRAAPLFGAFQRERFYRQARPRWEELARTARSAVVFADFKAAGTAAGNGAAGGVHAVHLPTEAPMRREWSLVCDAPDHTAALAAWELPGQGNVARRRPPLRVRVDPRAGRGA